VAVRRVGVQVAADIPVAEHRLERSGLHWLSEWQKIFYELQTDQRTGSTMRHILIATDGSDSADRATEAAAKLAKAMGSRLSILTVGGNLSAEEMRQLARAEGNVPDALEALSNQILWQAREKALHAGVTDVHTQSGWGDPAEVIIETARREHADAIVLGRRGRGQLAGLLLGSVSQKVTSLAPCAVIVVP
jgi:nucleotide-binding universal stress UspA family protein